MQRVLLIVINSSTPVSYTHLDVYKRQDKEWVEYNFIAQIDITFLIFYLDSN